MKCNSILAFKINLMYEAGVVATDAPQTKTPLRDPMTTNDRPDQLP